MLCSQGMEKPSWYWPAFMASEGTLRAARGGDQLSYGRGAENLFIGIRSERTMIILPNGLNMELSSKCVSIPYISAALRPGQSVCRKPPANVASISYPLSPTLREHQGRGSRTIVRARGQEGFERNSVSGHDRVTTLGNSRQLWLPGQGHASQHSTMMREELRRPPHLAKELWMVKASEGK